MAETQNSPDGQQFSIDPDVSQAELDFAIDRATAPLQEAMSSGMVSPERQRILGDRILQVSEIVQENPERVAKDADKLPGHKTEYDPERAHLAALAIDGNMTRLTGHDNRVQEGKFTTPWARKRAEKDILATVHGEKLANDTYDADPIGASPKTVEARRLNLVNRGYSKYKNIKSAKLPKS